MQPPDERRGPDAADAANATGHDSIASSEFSLRERHAVVCGATQGIGRAIAERFAQAGASVTIVGRNPDGLARVLDGLDRSADQVHDSILVDFSDWRAVQAAGDERAQRGPVHVLVNNTGGPPAGFLTDAEPDAIIDAFSLHVACAQALVRSFAPGMRDAAYGRVLNIISTSVVTPITGLGVSNVVRGAMGNWGRTLAAELARFGITVNNILPGFTDTARLQSIFEGRAARAATSPDDVRADAMRAIPAGRIGAPHEIASVALFLASPAGSYVNGVNLPVDGGRLVKG